MHRRVKAGLGGRLGDSGKGGSGVPDCREMRTAKPFLEEELRDCLCSDPS